MVAIWLDGSYQGFNIRVAVDSLVAAGTIPVLIVSCLTKELALRMGVGILRARLDSLGIRCADTTFTGGHIDRVRERFTQHMLPVVGK